MLSAAQWIAGLTSNVASCINSKILKNMLKRLGYANIRKLSKTLKNVEKLENKKNMKNTVENIAIT